MVSGRLRLTGAVWYMTDHQDSGRHARLVQEEAWVWAGTPNTYTVWTSVASPARPMYSRSPMGKIFWKSVVTIWAWIPKRLSAAMATQFFPFMAITAPPL